MIRRTKKFKLTPIRRSILWMIRDHKTVQEIASALKVSHQTISYHITRLLQNDYLHKGTKLHSHGYYFSSASLSLLEKEQQRKIEDYHRVAERPATDDKDQSKIRLHGVHIKYDLESPLSQENLNRIIHLRKFPVKPIPVRGHTDYAVRFGSVYQYATGIVRTRSFTIEGLQLEIPPGISVEEAENWYAHSITGIIYRIESQLQAVIPGFKLKRDTSNMIIPKVIQRHLAFVNHPIAQGIPEGQKLTITDPKDGKARIIVDRSHGDPELETVHNVFSLEDMKHIQRNTWMMAVNDLDNLFQKTDEELRYRDSVWNDRFDKVSTAIERIAGMNGGTTV